jgi:hydrogenase maturation factor
MPAATPIPRGPTVLTLYTAADLLTGPGCPVCRYAGEAADRYLAWFALEAHAQAVTITRLCSSLGMCPRHTRGLMSQSGAASRLTAVYRYVMPAARDRLGGTPWRLPRVRA